MKREILIQLVVLVLFGNRRVSGNESTICFNNQTGQSYCCQDYKNVSGTCEACIGSWGKNCENDCAFGFYGHGCRKRCLCNPQQECDKKQGCIEPRVVNNSTTSGIDSNKDSSGLETIYFSVAVVLILILSGILYLYFHKKSREVKKKRHIKYTGSIDQQIDDQSSIYSDIRGSILVNPADDTLFHYTLPRQFSNESDKRFQSLSCKSRGGNNVCYLKRSRSLEPNYYGHTGLESTDYNYLSFKLHNSAQNTSSEVDYDFCCQEMRPVESTQALISKDASKNICEEDLKPAFYIDVIDTCNGYACSSDVSEPYEY